MGLQLGVCKRLCINRNKVGIIVDLVMYFLHRAEWNGEGDIAVLLRTAIESARRALIVEGHYCGQWT